MRIAIARTIMVAATCCFGDHRRSWADAMNAEFDIAVEEGMPLSFACGCLLSAMRELPAHEDGRFGLASYVLALGTVVPIAALLLASVAQGYPFLAPIEAGADTLVGGGRPVSINVANQTGLPLLAILTLVLAIGHLYMAWAVLDRDWSRVASASFAAIALIVTSVIFTGILFWNDACALPQAAVTTIELLAIWSLVRWHDEMFNTARPHPT